MSSQSVVLAAIASRCTSYDCEYIVLAEALGVPLVTFDGEVRRAFPDRAVAPEAFVRD